MSIPHKMENGVNVIASETLKAIAPEAYDQQPEEGPVWIMLAKPIKLSDAADEDGREEWSETNEPELAERIAEDWDNLQVNGVVILCGTYDDEYGWLWNAKDGMWESYMY